MTKRELIENISKEAKISKGSAEKALDAFTNTVMKALKKRDKLTLTSLGTLSVTERRLARLASRKRRKTTGFLHVAKPATANKILRSLKIDKPSEYAIHDKLSH